MNDPADASELIARIETALGKLVQHDFEERVREMVTAAFSEVHDRFVALERAVGIRR